MTRPRVKLHVADGWWVAEIDVSRTQSGSAVMAARWTGPVPVLNPEQRTAWLEQIKAEPWDIYRFLQGEACLSLEDVVQAAAETSASGMEAGTNAARDVKQVLRAGLKSEPHFCLELIGMTREELLEYVFSTWARELSHVQGTSSALEPTSRSEGGRSGLAAISEWIAESAAEGALHRPGAGFHAIEIRLPRKLAFKNEAADIAALLPGLSRAEEAMKLIRERVAERARAAIPQKRHAP
ncbi:phosphoribosylglycinamide synthetase [Paenibacillus farraposensis]|uniref:Phosphoribosylglycinamide synthetase n=1 Tax=Paenibacillus farraposensis TaxID=2807095 RepID=A0ABW4DCU3_9BACL|nr:phosphoribosylglycinamide synthetase [Paenibacillus farraposensis]MCC3379032.1 phosphoribosylglycinamide synthetase [Paenibacillus farraposensis]